MDPVDPSITISDMRDGCPVFEGPLRRLDPPKAIEMDGFIVVLSSVPINRLEVGCPKDMVQEVTARGGGYNLHLIIIMDEVPQGNNNYPGVMAPSQQHRRPNGGSWIWLFDKAFFR